MWFLLEAYLLSSTQRHLAMSCCQGENRQALYTRPDPSEAMTILPALRKLLWLLANLILGVCPCQGTVWSSLLLLTIRGEILFDVSSSHKHWWPCCWLGMSPLLFPCWLHRCPNLLCGTVYMPVAQSLELGSDMKRLALYKFVRHCTSSVSVPSATWK